MPSPSSSPAIDASGKAWWHRAWVWLHQYGSPPVFYDFSRRWQTPSFVVFLLLAIPSIAYGLWLAPADYLQGDSYRIIYIHVPAAWMSLMVYAFMAAQGAIALIWRVRICEILISAAAPIGAMFTAVTLLTGMIWGRPTWGTYWTWDARLTSQLVLLFLYLGVMALAAAYADRRQGARAAAVLALIGVVNLPIIRYSVEWWNTLHQSATIRLIGPDTISGSMALPLWGMVLATKFYFLAVLLLRARTLLVEQDRGKAWLRERLGVSTGSDMAATARPDTGHGGTQ
jgi:heme exporter protein C